MGDLAVIGPKLSKLIPMLSSDQDGEVIAAARAICRMLKNTGLDLHDLAKAVTTKTIFVSDHRPEPKSLCDIAAWCQIHNGGRFTDRERRFITDMVAHLGMGRPITEKQENWLRAIFRQLGGEYVP